MAIDKQGYFCYINFTRYPLHHLKGTLMMSTKDEHRQQVLAWIERLLKKHASMAFIFESVFDDIESLVEKSGTGMRAEKNWLQADTWNVDRF